MKQTILVKDIKWLMNSKSCEILVNIANNNYADIHRRADTSHSHTFHTLQRIKNASLIKTESKAHDSIYHLTKKGILIRNELLGIFSEVNI